MLRDKLTTVGVSVGVHVAAAGLLAWMVVDHVQRAPEEPEYMELEILPPDPERPQPEAQPIAPPKPLEPPLPIPTEPRPRTVPDRVEVTKVDRALPFQDNANDTGTRDALADTEAVPAPTAVPRFDMESTVGGGGAEYETTSDGAGGSVPVAARGAGIGGAGPDGNQGAVNVKVARDWQISQLPEPLNDDDFEPDYPPLARREGREATVVVSLTIDPDGRVVAVDIVSGPTEHGFRAAARSYARKLRFRPARAGNRNVGSRIEWTVYFHVRN